MRTGPQSSARPFPRSRVGRVDTLFSEATFSERAATNNIRPVAETSTGANGVIVGQGSARLGYPLERGMELEDDLLCHCSLVRGGHFHWDRVVGYEKGHAKWLRDGCVVDGLRTGTSCVYCNSGHSLTCKRKRQVDKASETVLCI